MVSHLDEQVIVDIHKYILKKECVIDGTSSREELPLIAGILIDVVSVVLPLDIMVDDIGSIRSFLSWHTIRGLLP